MRSREIYGFLGPNGAGKTTTIHMLLNLVQPTSGRVCLFGEPLDRGSFAFRQHIRRGRGRPVELSRLTGWELVRFFGRLCGVDAPERCMEELFRRSSCGTRVTRWLATTRAGMRQKLSLIRALVHSPRLLILDEPVSGLDPHGIRQVRELIHAYRDQGGRPSSPVISFPRSNAPRIASASCTRDPSLIEDSLAGLRRRLGSGRRLTVELEHFDAPLVERLSRNRTCSTSSWSMAGDKSSCFSKMAKMFARGSPSSSPSPGGVILRMESEEMSLEEAFVTFTNQNVNRLAGWHEDESRGSREVEKSRRR